MATAVTEQVRQERAARPRPSSGSFNFSSWTYLSPPPPSLAAPANGRPLPVSYWERFVALGLLIPLTPLFGIVAAAIKLSSPGGPILYRQERVGLNRRRNGDCRAPLRVPERRVTRGYGRVFWMYKFRTMIPDAERLTGPIWASERDPRITRVGRILRHLRMDELPQLINVLRSEMRLIGPRPERPHFVQQLCAEIPDYADRQNVPPGITGLAQVEREYDATISDVERKIKYDLYYARHRSGALDIKILLKTIDVMLRGRGAR